MWSAGWMKCSASTGKGTFGFSFFWGGMMEKVERTGFFRHRHRVYRYDRAGVKSHLFQLPTGLIYILQRFTVAAQDPEACRAVQ